MKTFKPDQLVLVRENDTQVWRVTTRERAGTCFWHYCESLRKHFAVPKE